MKTLAFDAIVPELKVPRKVMGDYMAQCAENICPETFHSVMSSGCETLLRHVFAMVRASEGTVWICNEEETQLVPVFNSGSKAAEMLATVRQALNNGCISLVFANGQAFAENDIKKNPKHDPTTDKTLKFITHAMLAAPLRIMGKTCGVVSCVILGKPDEKNDEPLPDFTDGDQIIFNFYVQVFEKLIDHQILNKALAL